MASGSFPSCSAPQTITQIVTSSSVRLMWTGAATTYRLRYKRAEQNDTHWIEINQPGPGSSGGSGEHATLGITYPVVSSSSVGAGTSADFTASGLTPGVYDFLLYNVCADGSWYVMRRTVFVRAATTKIQNLAVALSGNSAINVTWDDTGTSGEPYTVRWDVDGDVDNSAPITGTNYTIENLVAGTYRIYVTQPISAEQARSSDAETINYCGDCDSKTSGGSGGSGGGGSFFLHLQALAAAVWDIPHNLGYYPNVDVYDTAGTRFLSPIEHVNVNRLRVVNGAAFGGEAHLS